MTGLKETTRNESITKTQKKKRKGGDLWRRFKKNKGAVIGLCLILLMTLMACSAAFFIDYDTQVIGQNISERLQSPSVNHPMGTDHLGRDIMARVVYGSRYSLLIGIVAIAIALLMGVIFGAIAGFFGGIIEDVIMRASDIFMAIPNILMAIVIVAALGQNMLNLMIAIGIVMVPIFIRTTRAAVLTVRTQEYVEAAKAIGLPDSKIIFKHVLINCLSPVIVTTTTSIAAAIIQSSSLSFLGLGIPAPSPEWGSMLSEGRAFIRDSSYMTLFPGLFIMLTVLAFNLVGDGLRDALDPKLKR